MASSRGVRPALLALGLMASGAVADTAWRDGLWGLLAGALLAAAWLGALNWWGAHRDRPMPLPAAESAPADLTANRLLLDAAPTPMLAIEGDVARARNRAARRLFATNDRVLPVPPALLDPAAAHLIHEARHWRVDRVMLTDPAGRAVVALIDIEQEERVAEARAAAEMIHVLGHELLNGLAPIASLAESGEALLRAPEMDVALLREVLGTLARRTEGLQRFTEAYRSLARLPEPQRRPVAIVELVRDLRNLFTGRWPGVTLLVDMDDMTTWPLDRDQIVQALWALLQNAAEAVLDPGGKVRLTIKTNASALAIDVSDDGAGVPPGDILHLFRPFHTTKPSGTGVGLSLARQIAHAHGGTLMLEPIPQTTFRLRIPKP